jgi:hypothetical protein
MSSYIPFNTIITFFSFIAYDYLLVLKSIKEIIETNALNAKNVWFHVIKITNPPYLLHFFQIKNGVS